MKRMDPQYDAVVLTNEDELDEAKKWIDRLKERLQDEIDLMEEAVRAFEHTVPPDQEPEGVVALVGYHTTEDNVAGMARLVEDVLEQRKRMLDLATETAARLEKLRERIQAGKPALFVFESIWYTFGYKYLYSEDDVDFGNSMFVSFYPYWWYPYYIFPLWPFFWF